MPLPPVGPKRLIVSATAENDINDALSYLKESAGVSVALRFAERVDVDLQRLARLGHSGVPRDVISPGLRMMVLGQYCAYFRVTKDSVRIIRFVHSARDVEGLFAAAPDDDENV